MQQYDSFEYFDVSTKKYDSFDKYFKNLRLRQLYFIEIDCHSKIFSKFIFLF